MKPWTLVPYQLIQHADGHFKEGKDIDRKIAIVGFDNAIELCIDVFVNLHPRLRDNYQIKKEDIPKILQNYHTKMDFLDRYLKEKNESIGISVDEIIWYHTLRNELYHSGNGMIPELFTLNNIRAGAIKIFEYLFEEKYEEILENAEIETEKPAIGSSSKMLFISQWINFEANVRELYNLISSEEGNTKRPLNYIWENLSKKINITESFNKDFYSVSKIRNSIIHAEEVSENDIENSLEKLETLKSYINTTSNAFKTKIVVTKILPIIIDFAKNQKTITYGELAKKSGLNHHRPIPGALSFIRDKICIPNKYPEINIIVVNKSTGVAGEVTLTDDEEIFMSSSKTELWNKKLELVWNFKNWDLLKEINIFSL